MVVSRKSLKSKLISFCGHSLVPIIKLIGTKTLMRWCDNRTIQHWVNQRVKRRLEKEIDFIEHNQRLILPHLNEAKYAELRNALTRNSMICGIESLGMNGSHFAQTEWLGQKHIPKPHSKILFVSAHINNWEMCRRNLDYLGFRCQYLYRDFSDTPFDHRPFNFRHRHGNGGVSTKQTKEFVNHIINGGNGFTLIDIKDQGRNGLKSPFCGHQAWTSSFPAQLALNHGATLVPTYIERKPNGYKQYFLEPIKAEGLSEQVLTDRINTIFSHIILEKPEQWLLWDTNRWGPWARKHIDNNQATQAQ